MNVKKILLIIAVLAIISFVFVFVYDMTNVERQKEANQRINQSGLSGQSAPPRPEDQVLKVQLSGVLLTIGFIFIAFYFTYSFLEQNFKKELSVVTSIAGDDKEKNPSNDHGDMDKTIMNLLNPNERRIVKQLVENHGVCLQSDISRMNEMGKVKAHRYLQNLSKMGVVQIERYGNTNKIIISDNVKKIFLK
jgi:predicted transcriptional regulator